MKETTDRPIGKRREWKTNLFKTFGLVCWFYLSHQSRRWGSYKQFSIFFQLNIPGNICQRHLVQFTLVWYNIDDILTVIWSFLSVEGITIKLLWARSTCRNNKERLIKPVSSSKKIIVLLVLICQYDMGVDVGSTPDLVNLPPAPRLHIWPRTQKYRLIGYLVWFLGLCHIYIERGVI